MIVLVVEDDAELRGTLARFFARAGWTVWRAADVREAQELLAGGRPDVILADRRLPTGRGATEDGAALIDTGIPVVIYSGIADPVPGATVIEKPCRGGMAELVRRVTEAAGTPAVDDAFEGPIAGW